MFRGSGYDASSVQKFEPLQSMPGAERASKVGISGKLERRLGGAPGHWIQGLDLDLLAPLRWVEPGSVPQLAPSPPAARAELAWLLESSNRTWGHPKAGELAQRFAASTTRVVVTGQQCGLFGGPLLVLAKLAAAVRWSEELSRSGQPAVALFVMASEDHDFSEVASARFLVDTRCEELSLGLNSEPLRPVGLRKLGPEVEKLLEQLKAWYPNERFLRWIEHLATWWHPGSRFPDAFARQWIALLGARAPLFLDPLATEFKRLAMPTLLQWIAAPEEVVRLLGERSRELEARGFQPQVPVEPEVQPYFWLDDQGRRQRVIRTASGTWAIRGRGEVGPWDSWMQQITSDPERVSPSALGRPAVADAVLGTALHVLGAAELAYFAQAAPLYALSNLQPPAVTLRPELLLWDRRSREWLEALGGVLNDLLQDPEGWRHQIASSSEGFFLEPGRSQILETMATWAVPAAALDSDLLRPYARTRETVERALSLFARRVEEALLRRNRVRGERVERLLATVRPGGIPQERGLAAAYWLGRFGQVLGERVLNGLELDPRWVTVLDPGGDPEAVVGADSLPSMVLPEVAEAPSAGDPEGASAR